jgi:antitoxin CptB
MSKLGRLRWQCRRGAKELDLVLLDYLENHYSLADADEQNRFIELLQLEDTELLTTIMKSEPPFTVNG